MAPRWSKLQKELYLLRADGLNFQLHCNAYRMASQHGSTDIPRYWITLNGEIIWDYPKDFIDKPHPAREKPAHFPYSTDIPDISAIIREYVDTPKDLLLSKEFQNDHWGLVNILRAADKRIGLRRLPTLRKKTGNKAAHKIIEARLLMATDAETKNKEL